MAGKPVLVPIDVEVLRKAVFREDRLTGDVVIE